MMDVFISAFYSLLKGLNYHHPIHPIVVHVTVGSVVAAFILGILGYLRRKPELGQAARYCLIIALVFAGPTVATGFMDWRHFFSAIFIFPFKMKLILASILFGLLLAGFMLGRRRSGPKSALTLVYAFSLMAVAGLGYFGGDLVYGGKSKPPSEKFQSGSRLYLDNCAGCHPKGGNALASGLPVRNSPKTARLDSFVAWIRAPRQPMPGFPNTVISDREAQDLFDYVFHVLNKA